jgi:hypothetical protein
MLKKKWLERILSADNMEGRRAFTPGIDKASFIESEFKKIGLETFNRAKRQASIFMTESKRTLNVQIDGTAIND